MDIIEREKITKQVISLLQGINYYEAEQIIKAVEFQIKFHSKIVWNLKVEK